MTRQEQLQLERAQLEDDITEAEHQRSVAETDDLADADHELERARTALEYWKAEHEEELT